MSENTNQNQAPAADKTDDKPKKEAPQSKMTKSDLAAYEKAIRTQKTGAMDPIEYKQFQVQANDIIQSGAAPKSFENPLQILMAFQVGKEMGMKPIESLHSLYIVNGAINVWGKAVIRRVREHGWSIKYKDEDGKTSCTAVLTKKNKAGEVIEEIEETYTFEEAQASGYTTDNYGKLKVGWKEGINRRLKLRYGVLSLAIKSYIPEVLGSAVGIAEVEMDYVPETKTDHGANINAALEAKKKNGEKVVDTRAREKAVEGEIVDHADDVQNS